VTVGDNSDNGVTGYQAAPGWDLATGWGTPDIAQFFGGTGTLTPGALTPALLTQAHSLTP
jgi:kumamolisin